MPFSSSLRLQSVCLAALSSLAVPAFAVQVTDHLDLGGAVRARWDYDPDRDIPEVQLRHRLPHRQIRLRQLDRRGQVPFYGGPTRTKYTNQ